VNGSEGGQWLGRTRVRAALQISMTVQHLSEAWVESTWDAFATHAESNPFFIADKPGGYPKSCAYAWSGSDLRAERQLANATVANAVTLELTGFLQ